jgi:hypothetical protein
MAHLGLLLTHNEIDVIEEYLEATLPYFDGVFALDHSDDGTFDVLSSYPKVLRIFRQNEVAPQGICDADRQILLDAARKAFGPGHWYALLHADEFFYHNPRIVAEQAEAEGAHWVNWIALQFFFHPQDQDRPLWEIPSVQDRLQWYSPLWVEVRQFRDRPQAAYRPGEHRRVIPRGIGWRPYSKAPVLFHYPYRSPDQFAAKRKNPGFSDSFNDPELFRPTFQPAYRRAYSRAQGLGPFEHPQPLWRLLFWRWRYLDPRRLG